jgi:hypothetical protein
MNGEVSALRTALDLLHIPSRVRWARSNALPDGMGLLLQVAAKDESAVALAAKSMARPAATLRDAAAFFIEQILFAPDADSYRVLGASDKATGGELRRNMALLLKWLHPDANRQDERSVFAGRVIRAWDDLKTPARRDAYDLARAAASAAAGRCEGIEARRGGGKPRQTSGHRAPSSHLRSRRFLRSRGRAR